MNSIISINSGFLKEFDSLDPGISKADITKILGAPISVGKESWNYNELRAPKVGEQLKMYKLVFNGEILVSKNVIGGPDATGSLQRERAQKKSPSKYQVSIQFESPFHMKNRDKAYYRGNSKKSANVYIFLNGMRLAKLPLSLQGSLLTHEYFGEIELDFLSDSSFFELELGINSQSIRHKIVGINTSNGKYLYISQSKGWRHFHVEQEKIPRGID